MMTSPRRKTSKKPSFRVWERSEKYREAVTSGLDRLGGMRGRKVCNREWGGGGDYGL